MSSELSNFRMDRIIVHQIFPRSEEKEVVTPKYSSQCTTLDTGGLNMFQERVVGVLGNDSHSMEMSIKDDSQYGAYSICSQMLNSDDETFKELSKKLTDRLANAQSSRKIPGGIILIFTGLVGSDDRRYIGIIKAELHEGFGIQQQLDLLTLEYIADLLLTPQQKLYKAAMFIDMSELKTQPITPKDFRVLVYDHNMVRFDAGQAAQYFYDAFLGCTVLTTAKTLTRDFFCGTKEFIDGFITDEETMLDLNTALHAYLKVEQTSIISISDFASRYLPEEIRDSFLTFMTTAGFPEQSTPKDTAYIKSKLKQRNLKFTSDVKIVAPSENFADVITIVNRENGNTIVSIKGRVESDN